MAKDKSKWTRSPDDPIYTGEILLPSFGLRVTRSSPRTEAYPTRLGSYDLSPDSGDAFSVSYLHRKGEATAVDRGYMGLDPGYVRRTLLRVLDAEEYQGILDHYNARNRLEVKPGVPEGSRPTPLDLRKVKDPDPKGQVRITDLRLAETLTRKDLERELRTAMSDLALPVTVDEVLRWKWKTLREPKGMRSTSDLFERADWFEEEAIRVTAISFAAAALCLFIDLDMKNLHEVDRDALIDLIIELYTEIRHLIANVDGSVERVSGLLGGRKGTKGGRPSDPAAKNYVALVLHRMGRPPFEIARRVDISSPEPSDWEEPNGARKKPGFNANWKNKLGAIVRKGIDIERETFPGAAEVFAHRDKEEVQETARAAYHDYLDAQSWTEVEKHLEPFGPGDDLLGPPVSEAQQKLNALIQLGCCIENSIDPFPDTIK